jgi:hypothetical protein
MRDLDREASEAKGQYSDATREVGRLEANLAVVQATLRASEKETALARAETTDIHASAVGTSLTPRASVCFSSISVSEAVIGC